MSVNYVLFDWLVFVGYVVILLLSGWWFNCKCVNLS